MRVTRPAQAAAVGLALLGAAPAHAAVVYAYTRPGAQYVLVRPDFETGPLTLPFDSCAPATCLNASFQQVPGGDRLVVAETGGVTAIHDFDDGAFGTQGIHRDGDALLAVAEVGSYAKGSVLYFISSPRGVFGYVAPGLLTGDTPELPLDTCLPTASVTCAGIRFDFGDQPGWTDTLIFRFRPNSGSSTLVDYHFDPGAFGRAGAYFDEDSFLRRLAVIPLPGGVSPPTGVPEPGTWALLILGFGVAGAALRRREALRAV